jgi:hypothetical protein
MDERPITRGKLIVWGYLKITSRGLYFCVKVDYTLIVKQEKKTILLKRREKN